LREKHKNLYYFLLKRPQDPREVFGILIEIRFHGRGGQGAVTAADLLAVAGFKDGYYTLSFPMFGAEKRGTPVVSFCRISDEPIAIRDEIKTPDYVAVMDPSLFDVVNVVAGLKKGGVLVANYSKGPEEIKEKLKVEDIKIYTINATKLATEILGRPITNTAIVGALVGATDVVSLNSLEEAIKEFFRGEIAEKNVELVRKAYEYMKEVRK